VISVFLSILAILAIF